MSKRLNSLRDNLTKLKEKRRSCPLRLRTRRKTTSNLSRTFSQSLNSKSRISTSVLKNRASSYSSGRANAKMLRPSLSKLPTNLRTLRPTEPRSLQSLKILWLTLNATMMSSRRNTLRRLNSSAPDLRRTAKLDLIRFASLSLPHGQLKKFWRMLDSAGRKIKPSLSKSKSSSSFNSKKSVPSAKSKSKLMISTCAAFKTVSVRA